MKANNKGPSQKRTAAKKQPTGDYSVGYCKPPKDTQFKRGNAGRARRVRRSQESILEIFGRVLAEKIKVPNGDKVRIMTKGDAVLYVNHQKALKSDQKAMHNIFVLAEAGQLLQDPAEVEPIGGKIVIPAPFDTEEEWAEAAKQYALERLKKQST